MVPLNVQGTLIPINFMTFSVFHNTFWVSVTIMAVVNCIIASLIVQDCAICFEKLCNISSFDDESGSSEKSNSSGIKQLTQCKHSFHASCLQAMYNSGTKVKEGEIEGANSLNFA